MKSILLFIVGIFAGFILLSNKNGLNVTNRTNQSEKNKLDNDRYGNYDPGKDKKFSLEERTYFNKIAKISEFSGDCEISRWTSDIKIYVKGEKRDYLMSELKKIIYELNVIINPINLLIVDSEEESNYQILFGTQSEYNDFKPSSKEHTPKNWGLFIIDSGREIERGSMYVDIYRCEDKNGQKHLLREELTQSLGLTNDSYDYPESIFYQKWTETTEYSPIDRRLIEMLYNHW